MVSTNTGKKEVLHMDIYIYCICEEKHLATLQLEDKTDICEDKQHMGL